MRIQNLAIGWLAIGITLLITACGDEDLMLDEELVAPFYLGYTDTLSLEMSTVIADSIVTSGSGRVLSGYYEDEQLGKVFAQSYFQLGLDGTLSLTENIVYDSLVLYFTANDYVYGDSSRLQHLSVHILQEELTPTEDDYFYNTQSLAYSDSNLGEISFLSTSQARDSLAIRLSDDLGQQLIELALNNDPILQNDDDFQDFMPGLTLLADTTQNSAVLGYVASSESIYMRLYYHETTEELERSTFDFVLSNSTLQFNHIATDRSSTLLASLHDISNPLPDSSTSMQTFAQGGVGLMTKISIPFLEDFPELGEYIYVSRAELVIEPVVNHIQELPLPDSLMLLNIGHNSEVLPLLSYGESFTSTLVWTSILELDDEYDRETEYRFDITDYILDKLESEEITNEYMLLTIPSYSNSVSRLYLGSSHNDEYETRLEISYTQFNSIID